ncbi:MAG: peptide chain release factor 3 [Thermoanaerobaculia bacterium]|nr:peptide chain release factor 3 [Thermoanaerobaculia bacterium]
MATTTPEALGPVQKQLRREIARRRTFAIISHPDAGKTTLTEKLLLYGGAIQLAGTVKARGERRRARSDWMKVERERGISVTVSVMTFDYGGCTFNLLDTPGHEDFSEDTYRTLTAVDSAVMVLDAAKGIESQTRKLFEVCRLRDVPILTFVNKLDRDGRDPFEIMDEIEQDLQLDVTPGSWPIGMGRSFRGCYELLHDRLALLERGDKERRQEGETVDGLHDPRVDELLEANEVTALREEVEMAQGLCPEFDRQSYLEGNMTAVYFGSALQSFGVQTLLDALVEMAPPPRPQPTKERPVEPQEEDVAGFVFKIQANMDPKHRDRLAFVRLASGQFRRGMKLHHPRSGKSMTMHSPVLFLAQDRELAEEAYAGDILGVPNHGDLHIGDALTEGEDLHFTGIPSFAPELLRRVRPEDPLRSKHLGRALQQLAEEGAALVLKSYIGNTWIVGVAGALQFEVLADRIRTEYDVPVHFESTQMQTARWVISDDVKELKRFQSRNETQMASDHHDLPVYLAKSNWQLSCAIEDWPDVQFLKTREQVR